VQGRRKIKKVPSPSPVQHVVGWQLALRCKHKDDSTWAGPAADWPGDAGGGARVLGEKLAFSLRGRRV
jgi:hypothetical protein